jgi:hypothetical protein
MNTGMDFRAQEHVAPEPPPAASRESLEPWSVAAKPHQILNYGGSAATSPRPRPAGFL